MGNMNVYEVTKQIEDEMIAFAQEVVRTRSLTCKEQNVVKLIEDRMRKLGYDRVEEDDMGNVMGVIGTGEPYVLFDGHMDTVDVVDGSEWKYGPYSGEIVDGLLYGRGSSDMKSGLVASIYGAYVAKEAGLIPKDRSVWVSASLMEEDFDGEALRYVLESRKLRPEYVVVCEPTTDLRIGVGHRGRSLIEVNVEGVGCHGSSPHKGKNPIYVLSQVIDRVKKLNEDFYRMPGEHPSVACTKIYCLTASENAVPQTATVVLDRRTALGDTEESVSAEMDKLIAGLDGASWRFRDFKGTSWKGMDFVYHNFMKAWELPPTHPLIQKTAALVRDVCKKEPELFRFQDNTNATSSAGTFDIPSVIICPGNLETAHARDEYCPVKDIVEACQIYAYLCSEEKP